MNQAKRNKVVVWHCASICIMMSIVVGYSSPLAFPGAVGFGAYATGGRTGTVYRVTTLADSGPGSFRDAVSQPNRIIIFDVGGYITLSSEVSVKPNITIAGQTAPGGGIAIRGAEVSFGSSSNIIVRHVRFRPGSLAPEGAHCANLYKGTNMIFDHCTFEYGPWNNIGGVNCSEVTFQRCLIADPIYQQFGAHMEQIGGRVMWYRCLFANGHNRQPLSKINTVFINNVVYNYEAAYTCGNTSGKFFHDIIGNYFITGPATDTPGNDFYQIGSNQSIYEQDNIRDSNRNGLLDGSPTYVGEGTALTSPWSEWSTMVLTLPSAWAFRHVVSEAGAFPRDKIDELILGEVLSLGVRGPNPLPSSQSRTGLPDNGFGVIESSAAPSDSDLDGMPDYWELAMGANPLKNDAMEITAEGYAKIEYYLNWLAEPHAVTKANTPVEISLSDYSCGFTNASPVYRILETSYGTASLISANRVRFTPNPDFYGMASLKFSVTSSEGFILTNAINILVVPISTRAKLVWRGDGVSNLWAVELETNWINNGQPAVFRIGDDALLDDTGSNTPPVWLVGNISPNEVIVSSSKDYEFTGSGCLVGGVRIVKTGPGKLVITTTNSTTGVVMIEGGTLQLGDGMQKNGVLGGTITNQAQLVYSVVGSITNPASISGDGMVRKKGPGYLVLTGVTAWSGPTLIESGIIEINSTALPRGNITNNGGLIIKTVGAVDCTALIAGSGFLTLAGSGLVKLSGSNTYAGPTTNLNGTLVLANNNAIGTGPIYYVGGFVALEGNRVITNDFVIPGNATTDLCMYATNGTGVWAGNVVVLGSGASWRPGADTGGTLVFTGTAHLGSRNFIVPRGTVHFASNALVTAYGTATALGRDSGDNNRSANITIRDNAKLLLGPCSLGGNKAGGSVTVTIRDNAVLSTGANPLDLNYVNRATATNTLRLNGGTLEVGGFVKSKTNLATIIFNGGQVVAASNNPSFLPALTYLRAEVREGGAIFDTREFNVTISAPLVHSATLGSALDGGITKKGKGTLILTGANSYNGPTIVSEGTLKIDSAACITNSSGIVLESNAVLDIGAFGNTPLVVGRGKRICGNGTIIGHVTVESGAILNPGGILVGKLTITGNLELRAGATNLFKLDPSSYTNDCISADTIKLGGILVVTNLTAEFRPGSQFKLINARVYTGEFEAVYLPNLCTGMEWDTSRLSTDGVITIKLAQTLQFKDVLLKNDGQITVRVVASQPLARFILLGHTNLFEPVANWWRLQTNTFDESGEFETSIPINKDNNTFFYQIKIE